MIINKNLRSADATAGLGGDSRERKLADGDGGAEIGGKAGSPDAAAAGADGEEVKIVLTSGIYAVIRLGGGRDVAAPVAVAEGEGAAVEVSDGRS